MKRLLLIAFTLIYFGSYAQFTTQQSLGSKSTMITAKGGLKEDSVFLLPFFVDTSSANNGPIVKLYPGNMIRVANDIWMRSDDGLSWVQMNGGGGGGGANNYPTSLAYNTGTGLLTLGRNGLSSLTVNLDGRYFLISDTTNKWVQNVYTRSDSLFVFKNGVETYIGNLGGGAADGNNFPSSFTFNPATGDATIGRTGLSSLTANLDGRYLTGNQTITASGDATGSGSTSLPLTLATVNGSPGSFGAASKSLSATVNGKGLVTSLSEQSIQVAESQVTNLTTDLSGKISATRNINTTFPVKGGGDLSADKTISLFPKVSQPQSISGHSPFSTTLNWDSLTTNFANTWYDGTMGASHNDTAFRVGGWHSNGVTSQSTDSIWYSIPPYKTWSLWPVRLPYKFHWGAFTYNRARGYWIFCGADPFNTATEQKTILTTTDFRTFTTRTSNYGGSNRILGAAWADDNGSVYWGFGQTDIADTSHHLDDIWKSDDDGATWSQIATNINISGFTLGGNDGNQFYYRNRFVYGIGAGGLYGTTKTFSKRCFKASIDDLTKWWEIDSIPLADGVQYPATANFNGWLWYINGNNGVSNTVGVHYLDLNDKWHSYNAGGYGGYGLNISHAQGTVVINDMLILLQGNDNNEGYVLKRSNKEFDETGKIIFGDQYFGTPDHYTSIRQNTNVGSETANMYAEFNAPVGGHNQGVQISNSKFGALNIVSDSTTDNATTINYNSSWYVGAGHPTGPYANNFIFYYAGTNYFPFGVIGPTGQFYLHNNAGSIPSINSRAAGRIVALTDTTSSGTDFGRLVANAVGDIYRDTSTLAGGGGGGGSSTFAGLTDVNVSSPSNLQFPQYQTSDNKWHNHTLVGVDLPTGSGNYIQNQNSGAQSSANAWIDGDFHSSRGLFDNYVWITRNGLPGVFLTNTAVSYANQSWGKAIDANGNLIFSTYDGGLSSQVDKFIMTRSGQFSVGVASFNGTEKFRVYGGYSRFEDFIEQVEQTAPSAGTTSGRYYVSSSDNHAHFVSSTNVDYDLTVASLTATQIGFGNGSNLLSGSSLFTWDNSNLFLTLGNGAGGEPKIILNAASGGSAPNILIKRNSLTNWGFGNDGSANFILNRYNLSGSFQGTDLMSEFTTGNILLNSLKTGSAAPTTTGTTKMVITDANGRLSFDNIPAGGGGITDPGSNGILSRTALNTVSARTITGTSNRISISDGDGVSGNPTIDIDAAYAGQTSITTLGTIGTGTWSATAIATNKGGTGATSIAAARINLQIEGRTTVADLNYTALTTDKYIAYTSISAPRIVTLPAANAVNAGYEIWISDESGSVTTTNTITIQRAGADNVNGATSVTISTLYGRRKLVSDGTSKWFFDQAEVRLNATQTVTNKTFDITNTYQTASDKFSIVDNIDNTRKIVFSAGSIATSTTRTVTVPDADLTMVGLTTSQTLTNKTLTAPVISSITNTGALTLPTVTGTIMQYAEATTASNATWGPGGDARENYYDVTAQAAAVTTITNPSGSAANHNTLIIRVKDNGTARAISGWGTQYRASTNLAFPTTTTLGKTMYMKFIFNSADTKWDLISVLDGF